MAHPITFKPLPVDPKLELMKRVEAAPQQHAEALLRAWEVLQTAHDKGLLDLVNGLMGGKDIIAGKLAEAANLPESVAAIRNAMAGARLLGSVDPDMLQRLAQGMEHAAQDHQKEEKPPSLFALARRAMSQDSRRGLSYMTHVLAALGRATAGSGH